MYPIIFKWSYQKGLTFESINERKKFSWFTAIKIHSDGDKLHREGGASGVISDVVNERAVRKIEEAVFDQVEFDSIEAIVKNTNKRG